MVEASFCFSSILKQNKELLHSLSSEVRVSFILESIKKNMEKFKENALSGVSKESEKIPESTLNTKKQKLDKNLIFQFLESIYDKVKEDLDPYIEFLPVIYFMNQICDPELDSSHINQDIFLNIIFNEKLRKKFFISLKM